MRAVGGGGAVTGEGEGGGGGAKVAECPAALHKYLPWCFVAGSHSLQPEL